MSYKHRYLETLFKYAFYEEKGNDMNPFDELCLRIGHEEYIDVNDWNNGKFKEFITNLENSINCSFKYQIEQNIDNTWIFENGFLKMDVWDYGQLETELDVKVTKEHIDKLKQLSLDFDKFISSLHKD